MGGIKTDFVFLQHHKIKMSNSLAGVPLHAAHELWLLDHFSNVLVDEGITERNEKLM